MAPVRQYETPLEQLSRLLVAARVRGVPFAEAWDVAVRPGRSIVMTNTARAPDGAIRWPTDRTDRTSWMFAISATREAWRSAYERWEPSRADRALAHLGDSLGVLDVVAQERAAGEGMPRVPALASAA